MEEKNITWQKISFLPQIAEMIDSMLDAAKETYGPLCQIKVHDDFTIKRIFEVTGRIFFVPLRLIPLNQLTGL